MSATLTTSAAQGARIQLIRQLGDELDSLGRTAKAKVLEVAGLLAEAKAELGHGNFTPWIEGNFSFSVRTAQRWMKFADDDAAGHLKNDNMSYLPEPDTEVAEDDDDAAPLIVDGTGDAIESAPPAPPAPPHVSHNSGCNEWYTPADIITAATAAMGGIDTDPASSEIANRTVMAKRFYTKDDDGLAQPWIGNVWMNPPYAQQLIDRFAEKLVGEMTAGNIMSALVLVNNATETKWFQRMAASATAICFPSSRIRFIGPDGKTGAPLQGQAILYFGKHITSFVREFRALGLILEPLNSKSQ